MNEQEILQNNEIVDLRSELVALENNCALLDAELDDSSILLLASEQNVEELEDKIAELEKALSHSEKELDSLKLDSNLTYEVLIPIISDFIDDECDHCDIAHALKKALAIRDLEMKAQGAINGYVSACKWSLGSQYDEEVAKNRAFNYAKALKNGDRNE